MGNKYQSNNSNSFPGAKALGCGERPSPCLRTPAFRNCSGSMSLQLLVIMVPVLFGFMGFAIDLGRLYLIRGELNQAANAMALAAAAQLLGTTASLGNATTVSQLSLRQRQRRRQQLQLRLAGDRRDFGNPQQHGESAGVLRDGHRCHGFWRRRQRQPGRWHYRAPRPHQSTMPTRPSSSSDCFPAEHR